MIATNFKGKIPLRNPTAFRPHLRRENLCSVLKNTSAELQFNQNTDRISNLGFHMS